MRKLLLGTVSISGAALMSGMLFSAELLMPSDAHADLISIGVSTTSTPVLVASHNGHATFTSSAIAGFSSVSVDATGTPPLPEPTLDTATIDASSTGGKTLYVWVTESGITTAVSKLKVGLTVNDFGGDATSATESALLSNADAIFGDAVIAGPVLFTAPGADTVIAPVTTAATYSLTTEYILKFSGAGTGSQDDTINIQQVVPEPASLAVLGAALFGLGAVRRRRRT